MPFAVLVVPMVIDRLFHFHRAITLACHRPDELTRADEKSDRYDENESHLNKNALN